VVTFGDSKVYFALARIPWKRKWERKWERKDEKG